MAFTHTLTFTYVRQGESVNVNVPATADSEHAIDVTVPPTTTDMEVDLDFVYSRLQACIISSDVALTVKTNSTSSPGNTLSILAGKPKCFVVSDGTTVNPFTADVTRLFISNATGGAATVQMRFLYDATP